MKYINDGTFEGMISDNEFENEDEKISYLKIDLYSDKDYVIEALCKNTQLPLTVNILSQKPHPKNWVVETLAVKGEGERKRLEAIIAGRGLLKQVKLDRGLCSFKIFTIATYPLLKILEVHYSSDIHIKGCENNNYPNGPISDLLKRKSEFIGIEDEVRLEKEKKEGESLVEELSRKWREKHGNIRKEEVDMVIKKHHKETCIYCDKVISGKELEGFNFVMKRCAECLEKTVYNDKENIPAEDVRQEDRVRCCSTHMNLFEVSLTSNGVESIWGCTMCNTLHNLCFSGGELKELINTLR